MANAPLISLTNIHKSYETGSVVTPILKSISLSVHEGDMLAVVGASGSGKSTLMNIIGLLDKADSGCYLLHEKDTALLNEPARAKLRNHAIGFVFQQFNLLPRLTVRQNVSLPLTYRQYALKAISQVVHQSLEKVGMGAYLDRYPNQLSGGQQQRVAIARALAGSPQLILADEPTGALDSATGEGVMKLFHALNQEGCTVLMVTHDKDVAAQCQRQITLSDGEIVAERVS